MRPVPACMGVRRAHILKQAATHVVFEPPPSISWKETYSEPRHDDRNPSCLLRLAMAVFCIKVTRALVEIFKFRIPGFCCGLKLASAR